MAGLLAAFPVVATAQGKIAFMSQRNGIAGIFVMHGDGSNPKQLTNQGDFEPSMSRNGMRIAFHSSLRHGDLEIYGMSANGTNQTRLTESPGADRDPQFSADGTKIVFVSERDGNYELYVMNADGSGETRLTNTPGLELYPSFSPDGTKIVFAYNQPFEAGIYVMNADGSGRTLLSDGVGDNQPSYSPDGSMIAFSSRRGPVPVPNVWVMNADGSGVVQLTDHVDHDTGPVFSPDGTKIAFVGWRGGNFEILVMNADGSDQVNITNNTSNDGPHSWSNTADSDGDGIEQSDDNCATTANADQADTDGDGAGNACDPDDDNDGDLDGADNCPLVANSDQANTDGDALGNACDPDDDNDGILDVADPDTAADLVNSLPDSVFNGGGNRNAFLSRLEAIEQRIAAGDIDQAIHELENLRRRVDGCGSAADSNDWIIDCTAQQQIRAVIDMLIANL